MELEKQKVEKLNELQKRILFAFAESWTEDLNYITDSEHKSYHLHEKIRKHLEVEEDYFYLELKNLFRFGYLDLINEKFYFMSNIPSAGSILNINDRLNEITIEMLKQGEKDKSCISKYGMLAINSYLLNKNKETIDEINNFKNDIINLKEEIEQHKGIINNFNSHILTIMTILITVFSIIGINLGTIKFLGEVLIEDVLLYIGTLIAVNVSLLMTLYCMFYLLNNVINRTTTNFTLKNNLRFWGVIFVLIIIAVALILRSVNYNI
ncbi:hypothetical protein J2Z35_002485 [Acetoanaerobium pronyense]|uniref:Uncharacterized protein n=1 Tax=Acetoanaerobium pronyense TaxID=1482736 RepID=A0ABS4KLM0_9FIRM|nr:hypothetical protein [Acetoanaerobium pronyense]MBP2028655.1 hypothetical protein [Acetoanaerobium pronyense]